MNVELKMETFQVRWAGVFLRQRGTFNGAWYGQGLDPAYPPSSWVSPRPAEDGLVSRLIWEGVLERDGTRPVDPPPPAWSMGTDWRRYAGWLVDRVLGLWRWFQRIATHLADAESWRWLAGRPDRDTDRRARALRWLVSQALPAGMTAVMLFQPVVASGAPAAPGSGLATGPVGPPAPAGAEFQVNSYTTDWQEQAAVAMDADGDFVVAWQSNGNDGETLGIFAQRYDRDGTPVGPEFQVNTYTTSSQWRPSVAMDADGDFVVAWVSYGQDGDQNGIYARRYDSSGVAQDTTEFQVNTYTTNDQYHPSVAMDADGDFVVAWHSYSQTAPLSDHDIYARRYSSSGVAQEATEFRVNTYTTYGQSSAAVAMDADGDFVVAWQSNSQFFATTDVYAQRFASDGTPQGGEFRVNEVTTNGQERPSVAMDADGDFVVAYHGYGYSGDRIYARQYDADGSAHATEFSVNTYTIGTQEYPQVAMDADGDFVVAWESYGQDGGLETVLARRFDAGGSAQGPEVMVNDYTTNDQDSPSAAMDADGDFVVAWQSDGQDGDNESVYAKRYDREPVVGGQVNAYTTDGQRRASVAMDADGAFVVAWDSISQDGSTTGVYGQRYRRDGTPVGTEFQVNTYTTDRQEQPAAAMDADGDFVVAWQSYGEDGSSHGVYLACYDNTGSRVTDHQVNAYTTGAQQNPSVAMDADGDFVVAWQGPGDGDTDGGIFARQFYSTCVPMGSEFQVNVYTTGAQQNPSAAMDADGAFVVAWDGPGVGEPLDRGVFARQYDAAGTDQGTEVRVNTYTTNDQHSPSTAMDADGDFVVAWESDAQDGSTNGVYGQRYDGGGTPQGSEFPVNTYTSSEQEQPSVAMDAGGDFVVAWQSWSQDGSRRGVFAQRYGADGTARGAEFQVNPVSAQDQQGPSVAMDDVGDFVVAWDGDQTTAVDNDVFFRLYRKLRIFLPLIMRNG